MKIHYLQHMAFEDLGNIEDWAIEKSHTLTATKFFENDPLPEIDTFDFLIVLGGPMNIYDEKVYPWLNAEKQFLKKAIQSKKKILGICLGAQLLADALRAKVYPNLEKEIGWFPIHKENLGYGLLADFPSEFPVFHWHGDTFEIPENADRLFSSDACKNQAFLYENHILGLQFHLEVSQKSIEQMVHFGKHEIIPGTYIQSENELLANRKILNRNKKLLFALLDGFAKY